MIQVKDMYNILTNFYAEADFAWKKGQQPGPQVKHMEVWSDQTKPRCELMQSMSSMGERDCEDILPEN